MKSTKSLRQFLEQLYQIKISQPLSDNFTIFKDNKNSYKKANSSDIYHTTENDCQQILEKAKFGSEEEKSPVGTSKLQRKKPTTNVCHTDASYQ